MKIRKLTRFERVLCATITFLSGYVIYSRLFDDFLEVDLTDLDARLERDQEWRDNLPPYTEFID